MVTLKDIALEAGVSPKTVSNVINGKLSKVSKEKAEQIQAIIRKRNYVPNSSARSLAGSNSRIIAIILERANNENVLSSSFHATLVGFIIQKVRRLGYYTMVSSAVSPEEIGQHLRTWNVAGAIFVGLFDDEIEKIHQSYDIPMVFIDSYSTLRSLSNVGLDDRKGGQLAAQYLLDRGHREIAFVSYQVCRQGVDRHRYEGFRDLLSDNGMPLIKEHEFILKAEASSESITGIVQSLTALRGRVTALFATSDQIASYLITGLHSQGLKVPEDISVIGFDNMPICLQITPRLTTIAQNIEQKAACAIDILFRHFTSKEPPVHTCAESIVLDVSLVERDSVRTMA